MTRPPETSVPLALYRALANRHDELARRLADHEYRAMRDALLSGHAFDIPRLGTAKRLASEMPDPPSTQAIPPLQVPLARIAAHPAPESLPCVGVIAKNASAASAEALLGLATEMNRAPFARVLFLTRCLSLIPFLSRYGFPCQGVGDAPAPEIGAVLAPRFDMGQIRDLETGEILWSRARHPA